MTEEFFKNNLETQDNEIFDLIKEESKRQSEGIELIASENIVSLAVLQAAGSILTNKYAEGYPKNRYYGGCEYVDKIEQIAINRACELFQAKYANVQPHSGSQANQAVFLALLNPGDKVMGLSLDNGGHLTHGYKVNMSGRWFDSCSYYANKETGLLDYDSIEEQALKFKPKLIIAGYSCYPQLIDFKRFSEIAKKVGAYFMADIAHIAGLVATGEHQNPINYADVVTSTTHKTLRGPRGGLIMTNNENIAKKINSAIFPGLQGGPLEHIIAAKAVCFKEALDPSFKTYIKQVKSNAKALAKTLEDEGFKLVTGGTETHKMLVDLTPFNISGVDAEILLERAGLTCNKNTIPNDPLGAKITSGIRLGTPSGTTRGFKEQEFIKIGKLISNILKNPQDKVISEAKEDVVKLCSDFPIY